MGSNITEGFVLLSVTPLISSDFFKLRGVIVFNTTFNNISVISRRYFFYVNDLLKLNLLEVSVMIYFCPKSNGL
jgi:hypothetical protein